MKLAEIKKLLPNTYQYTLQKSKPMQAILSVMEAQHEPVEILLKNLDEYFDPYRAPSRFVPYLARWMDLDRFFSESLLGTDEESQEPLLSGQGRLRELITAASYLSQWRGTANGLQLFLEIATGNSGYVIDENVKDESGVVKPFHFLVTAPVTAKKFRSLIVQIIEQEKPAYVSYSLRFND